MISKKQARFWQRASTIALTAGVLTVLLGLAAGPGFRFGLWSFGTAIDIMFASFVIGDVIFVVSLIALAVSAFGAHRGAAVKFAANMALVGGLILFLYFFRADAIATAPIHDVTTDLEDPPAFVHLPERHADATMEVPDKGRTDLALLEPQARWKVYHEENYGDLAPLDLNLPPERATEAVETTVRRLGWELADVDIDGGRVEATDTTFWFGFKDDVVVRVTEIGPRTSRVDVRSVSRVGISDLGKNAARVRDFLEELQAVAADMS